MPLPALAADVFKIATPLLALSLWSKREHGLASDYVISFGRSLRKLGAIALIDIKVFRTRSPDHWRRTH
jgi:hypothetical protein